MRDRDLVDNFFLLLLLLPQLPYISCFGACTFIQSWNIFSMNKLLYMCALDFNLKFTCILFYILFMHSLINLHWLFFVIRKQFINAPKSMTLKKKICERVSFFSDSSFFHYFIATSAVVQYIHNVNSTHMNTFSVRHKMASSFAFSKI